MRGSSVSVFGALLWRVTLLSRESSYDFESLNRDNDNNKCCIERIPIVINKLDFMRGI